MRQAARHHDDAGRRGQARDDLVDLLDGLLHHAVVLDPGVEQEGDRGHPVVAADQAALDDRGRGEHRGEPLAVGLGDLVARDHGAVAVRADAVGEGREAEREALRVALDEEAEGVLELRIHVRLGLVVLARVLVAQVSALAIVEVVQVVQVVQVVEAAPVGRRLLVERDDQRGDGDPLDALHVVDALEPAREPMDVGEGLGREHVLGLDEEHDHVVGVSEAAPEGLVDRGLILDAARGELLRPRIGHERRDERAGPDRCQQDRPERQSATPGDEIRDRVDQGLHRWGRVYDL
ncbi:MAG: hypothetical protein R3B82_23445 [Sandaracinaceae bacterium]